MEVGAFDVVVGGLLHPALGLGRVEVAIQQLVDGGFGFGVAAFFDLVDEAGFLVRGVFAEFDGLLEVVSLVGQRVSPRKTLTKSRLSTSSG